MNYKEALRYLEEAQKQGIHPGLASIRELLQRLGNPQEKLQFVHIAGTNGKGSVLSYIASILMCQGYCVGTYISPTISCYEERFQCNHKMISKIRLARYVTRIQGCCQDMVNDGHANPTAFEVDTAIAMLYFVDCHCDMVVLETGMGGRFDATNVVTNTAVAVITSISIDHAAYLGDTLAEIAEHKAGIIKRGSHVVSSAQEAVVAKVIEEEATQQECLVTYVRLDQLRCKRMDLQGTVFSYLSYDRMTISQLGEYQMENAALSIEAIHALRRQGYEICEEAIYQGMACAKWPGRFTLLTKHPTVIIDGAHNVAGMIALKRSLEVYFPKKRMILIFGVFLDKEYEKMAETIVPMASAILTITPPTSRGLPAYSLAQLLQRIHPHVTAVDSIEEAVEMAYLLAGSEDLIVACGSLSYMGKLMEYVAQRIK